MPALFSIHVYDCVLASYSGAELALLVAVTLFTLVIWVVLDAARQRLLNLAAELDQRLLPSVLLHAATVSVGFAGPARDMQLLSQAPGGPPLVALVNAPWQPLVLPAPTLLQPPQGVVAVGVLLALALIAAQDSMPRRVGAEATALAVDQAQAFKALPRQAESWRAHNAPSALLQRAQRPRGRRMQRSTALQAGGAGFAALPRGLKQAPQAVLVAAGAWLVIDGELTPGVMIGATLLFGRLLGPLEALKQGWRPLREARPAAHWQAALLQQHASRPAGRAPPVPATGDPVSIVSAAAGGPLAPRLLVSDASMSWPGAAQPLLKGLNLALALGQRVVVIGAAASGNAPRRGWWSTDSVPADGTIADSNAYGQAADTMALGDAAVADGVAAWIERLPAGYDTHLARGAFEPSAHQWRGLLLARLLYGRPQLVVIDEPGAVAVGDSARVLRQAIEARRRAAEDFRQKLSVPAPIDGRVVDLRLLGPGSVVGAGQPLLDILPADTRLRVQARLRSADLADLADLVLGAAARVRITAFSSRETPLLPARVVLVGADRSTGPDAAEASVAAPDAAAAAPIVVRLEVAPTALPLAAGMNVEVLITTRAPSRWTPGYRRRPGCCSRPVASADPPSPR